MTALAMNSVVGALIGERLRLSAIRGNRPFRWRPGATCAGGGSGRAARCFEGRFLNAGTPIVLLLEAPSDRALPCGGVDRAQREKGARQAGPPSRRTRFGRVRRRPERGCCERRPCRS